MVEYRRKQQKDKHHAHHNHHHHYEDYAPSSSSCASLSSDDEERMKKKPKRRRGRPRIHNNKNNKNNNKSQKKKQIIKDFRLSGSAKELHGHAIYCVAWSNDIFCVDDDDNENDNDGAGAEALIKKEEEEEDDEEYDESSKQTTSTSTSSQKQQQSSSSSSSTTTTKTTHVQCFATCGGNHVTLYEVPNDHSSSSSSQMTMRQAYVDADPDEMFYSCAFGGRGLGSVCGYAPMVESDDDGAIILKDQEEKDEDEDEDDEKENKKKKNKKRKKYPPKNPYKTLLDFRSNDGPQLLCVSGRRGIVKIIDTVRRLLVMTLSGHGDEIYDMKFCPSSSSSSSSLEQWLLVTASKDESLRLWNVSTGVCVALFAGHEGHRDSVLCTGWNDVTRGGGGRKILSSGMDTTVKVWDLEGGEVGDVLEKSFDVRGRRKWGAGHHSVDDDDDDDKKNNKKNIKKEKQEDDQEETDKKNQKKNKKKKKNYTFRTVYEQIPLFSTNSVHTDYVDCVQFVGDLILSKSITNTIVLWKPIYPAQQEHHQNADGNNNNNNNANKKKEVLALREFTVLNCDVWFIRFTTDSDCRLLSIGTTRGEVKVWDIDTILDGDDGAIVGVGGGGGGLGKRTGVVGYEMQNKEGTPAIGVGSGGCSKKVTATKCLANLTNATCTSTVRMVSFSPSGKSVVSTCDDSTVWKWDAC